MSLDELHTAAAHAQAVLQRVALEGGIADQIARGEWDDRLGPDEVAAVTDVLRVVAEKVRSARALSGALGSAGTLFEQNDPLSHMGAHLPRNRKERFYTGTVLPAVVAADNFVHLAGSRSSVASRSSSTSSTRAAQFLTEYGFAESGVHPG